MVKVAIFLLSTAIFSVVNAFDPEKVKTQLLEAKIIPDAFEEFVPSTDMEITYGDDILVENGKVIKPELTLSAPRVWFDVAAKNPNTEYTFAMVNLDSNAPQVVHWMVNDINGANWASVTKDKYTAYKGPTPPAGSSNHRIVYALFEQQKQNATIIPILENNRVYFDLKKFAADNNLKVVNAAYSYTQHQAGLDKLQKPVKQNRLLDGLDDLLGNVGEIVDNLINDIGDVVDKIHIGGGRDRDDDRRKEANAIVRQHASASVAPKASAHAAAPKASAHGAPKASAVVSHSYYSINL